MLQILSTLLVVLSLLLAPLLGAVLSHQPLDRILTMSPVTQPELHPSFSWPVWIGMLLIILLTLLPLITIALRYKPKGNSAPQSPGSLPWWGWVGLVLVASFWILAWSRFAWFSVLQKHTFTPLWLGYILTINALTLRRAGMCLLRDHPGFFTALFPLSTGFWWYFEYINRITQNWYYLGLEDLGWGEYVVYCSLAFSTVLPAVLSTMIWLATFPRLSEPFSKLDPWPVPDFRAFWIALWVIGISGLAGVSVWPEFLFPMVWIAPILVVSAVRGIFGQPTIFSPLTNGDWRPVVLPALAALFCGFFWELWNSGSFAHWEYAIPFVNRFHLFEMPLLGYAGYLPFGLACLAIATLLPSSASALKLR